ncbi:hypothetical protein AB7M42_004855 [Bradyrhizobium diazoefficiens]
MASWGVGLRGPMQQFVAKANVDHYIGLLTGSDLTFNSQMAITRLLIAELDKLAHDQEHLEFAEKRAADGRDRVKRMTEMRDGHPFGTTEREQAERLLVNCENLQTVLEDFCNRLRERGSR